MSQDRKYRSSQQSPLGRTSVSSMFAIHSELDGDQSPKGDFVVREQFIGLLIGKEELLLSISEVREIIMLVPITYVPNAPQFIDGVINLRGNILPAINLRRMFGLARGEVTGNVRLVVVRRDNTSYALLVDGITHVIALAPTDIERQTLPGKGIAAEFLNSIAMHAPKVRGVLDLARILRTASTDLIHEQT